MGGLFKAGLDVNQYDRMPKSRKLNVVQLN